MLEVTLSRLPFFFSMDFSKFYKFNQIHLKERDIIKITYEMTGFRFSSLLFFFFFVLFLAAAFAVEDSDTAGRECVYTLNVKTGTIDSAGTDSNVTVTLGGENGETVVIPNLPEWGIMGSSHNYFENGDLDIFHLRASCVPKVCSIVVTSDGSQGNPGWYLEYVEVNTTGPNRPASGQTIHFEMNQWLAIDERPYSLTVSRNQC